MGKTTKSSKKSAAPVKDSVKESVKVLVEQQPVTTPAPSTKVVEEVVPSPPKAASKKQSKKSAPVAQTQVLPETKVLPDKVEETPQVVRSEPVVEVTPEPEVKAKKARKSQISSKGKKDKALTKTSDEGGSTSTGSETEETSADKDKKGTRWFIFLVDTVKELANEDLSEKERQEISDHVKKIEAERAKKQNRENKKPDIRKKRKAEMDPNLFSLKAFHARHPMQAAKKGFNSFTRLRAIEPHLYRCEFQIQEVLLGSGDKIVKRLEKNVYDYEGIKKKYDSPEFIQKAKNDYYLYFDTKVKAKTKAANPKSAKAKEAASTS